jgi:apolipoprotein N-acyltransferase
MSAVICLILTAAGGYFSFGLGNAWWLAWLTPVPVLWLAFGQMKAWTAFIVAWGAFALGLTSLLRAYLHVFPALVMALEILAPSLLFALATIGARRVNTALGAVAAMFAFAALWAGSDLLFSFNPRVGSILSPAIAEVAAPVLIQSAALVGFVGITFMLGTVAAGIALSLRTRNFAPILIAAGLFAANAAYGYLRISHSPTDVMPVALIDSNTYGYWVDETFPTSGIERAALGVINAYTTQIQGLRRERVQLIVLPENIARIDARWRDDARMKLATAADTTGATVVGGFNAILEGARRNMAWALVPGVSSPVIYEKRHLVAGIESNLFIAGSAPRILPDGAEPEICFDMDFPRTIRHDAVTMQPRMLAVSASEIGTHGDWSDLGDAADDWFHARDAVLRSVESGVPMARTAIRGLLTLSDRYGRIVNERRTSGRFTTLVGNLPLDGRGGSTLYDRIGDAFGWFCCALGLGLVAASFRRAPRPEPKLQDPLTRDCWSTRPSLDQ